MLVIHNQSHCTLAHFRGEFVRRLAHDGSTFSGVGASEQPGAVQLGVLVYSRDTDGGAAVRQYATAAAAALKVGLVLKDVAQQDEIAGAFRALAEAQADVIVVGRGGPFPADRQLTVGGAAAVRIPTIYNQLGYVQAGGLISYSGPSRVKTSTRLATFADHILRGAAPRDLPAEQIDGFEMAINLKTAKSLGLTIPPSVVFRADVVIE